MGCRLGRLKPGHVAVSESLLSFPIIGVLFIVCVEFGADSGAPILALSGERLALIQS